MGQNHWVLGGVRSGKTQALVEFAWQWWQDAAPTVHTGQSVLIFAMNADNRQQVSQRILATTAGTMPLRSATPLGFFEEEVKLFWPLISEHIHSNVSLPLRLRPESEQYLAVQFWGIDNLTALNAIETLSPERWARNLLDVIQLTAFAGIPLKEAVVRLQTHGSHSSLSDELRKHMSSMLCQWQRWCLDRGLLTYGLISDLYWRCLLPSPDYQARLDHRYAYILADDVETYPAIAAQFFEHCHHQEINGFYTSNPDFSVRLGLGADPTAMRKLQESLACKVQSVSSSNSSLGITLWPRLQSRLLGNDVNIDTDAVEHIETVTRSQLLRQTANKAIQLVKSGAAKAGDITILGPGLDSLARYALIDMIDAHGIPVMSWKEQRPLNASALVRSLITLLTLIYQNLGRFIDQDSVSEMMAVLGDIDPVRAGLLADSCFKPSLASPTLLPLEDFDRWDRVGSTGAQSYAKLRAWIGVRKSQRQSLSLPDCLSQAIAFFWSRRTFRYDEGAILRELLETAQHFGEVGNRLQDNRQPEQHMLQAFITVIRQGTMAANPYPLESAQTGIILATAYQYRIARLSHRYQFWLDVSSPLWQQGSLIKLWGAEAFLRDTTAMISDEEAAIALLQDLSHRAQEKIYLCNSELSTTGQEQMGTFNSLVSP